MKKIFTLTASAAILLAFAGCMKWDYYGECDQNGRNDHNGDHNRDSLTRYDAPVLFQYEYINYAWGYRHHGFLIDNRGTIKGFRQPEKWISPDSTGLMTKADLDYNLAQCDTVCGAVNRSDLEHYYGQIGDVRKGEILDQGMVMADAGTGVLSAWYWSEKAQKYESVLLESNGDFVKVNTHADVAEMVAWLKWIGMKTNRFYWFGK